MNCDEVRDLTGAYALGSVSPEEKRQVEDHLEDCDLHDEISGLTTTALGLAAATQELEPPKSWSKHLGCDSRRAGCGYHQTCSQANLAACHAHRVMAGRRRTGHRRGRANDLEH